jgi:hypothetical protein
MITVMISGFAGCCLILGKVIPGPPRGPNDMCAGVAAFPPEAATMSLRRARRRSDGSSDLVSHEMPRHLSPCRRSGARRSRSFTIPAPVASSRLGRKVRCRCRRPMRAGSTRCSIASRRSTPIWPVWIWPDDRPAVEVEAASLHHWLAHWSRDRACYAAAPAG